MTGPSRAISVHAWQKLRRGPLPLVRDSPLRRSMDVTRHDERNTSSLGYDAQPEPPYAGPYVRWRGRSVGAILPATRIDCWVLRTRPRSIPDRSVISRSCAAKLVSRIVAVDARASSHARRRMPGIRWNYPSTPLCARPAASPATSCAALRSASARARWGSSPGKRRRAVRPCSARAGSGSGIRRCCR